MRSETKFQLELMDMRMTDTEFSDMMMTIGKAQDYYYANIYPKVKETIREFKIEITKQFPEFVKQVRIEYIEAKVKKLQFRVLELRNLKKSIPSDVFIFDDELAQTKRDCYRFLNEYEIIKSGREMNGYPMDVIEQCREVRIETLEPLTGVSYKPGALNRFCCPIHGEKTPSFFVYPDNSWHCFGCSAHGLNAIDYVMQLKDIGFKEAIEFLKLKI